MLCIVYLTIFWFECCIGFLDDGLPRSVPHRWMIGVPFPTKKRWKPIIAMADFSCTCWHACLSIHIVDCFVCIPKKRTTTAYKQCIWSILYIYTFLPGSSGYVYTSHHHLHGLKLMVISHQLFFLWCLRGTFRVEGFTILIVYQKCVYTKGLYVF